MKEYLGVPLNEEDFLGRREIILLNLNKFKASQLE
jgi:hypothetical protein